MFHCQQAAEKAMRSFLTCRGIAFSRTHDLSLLAPLCIGTDSSLQEPLKPATGLSDYAVRFRYPGARYEPDTADGEAALQLATRVVDEIQRRLTPPLDEVPAPQQS
jgi:HEPN domain-containing protein